MTEMFAEHALVKFNNLTKKPEKFLSAPGDLLDSIHDLIKETYDFSKNQEHEDNSESLSYLIIKNFDVEQIWQQIELQNTSLLNDAVYRVSRLIAAKDRLWFLRDENNEDQNLEEKESQESNDDHCKNGDDINDDGSEASEEYGNDNDVENDNEKEINENRILKYKADRNIKASILDDDFFKLDEMTNFLIHEERDQSKKITKDSDDENSIDFFDVDAGDDLEEEIEDDPKSNPMYNEFFGNSDIEEELTDNEKYPEQTNVDSEDLEDVHTDIDEENEDIRKETFKDAKQKSSLELREERLQKKINELEEAALQEKSWQLKGEITGNSRPQNSLLEEVVEFDLTTRPAPIITQETTYKLEDIIRQRIKDRAWDSVERKVKPVETPIEYKKKLVLDQEKSKQSLAQIYESDYLKQKEALDPESEHKSEEEPKEHTEIKSLMKSLFVKLDSLSNFHFTPKAAIPELKIVSNLPAISMEEVAPVAASDAVLLAPEEIKSKPKGDVIGKGERTNSDKKRERRKKKQKQKLHAVEKLKKGLLSEQSKFGLNKKENKLKTVQLLDKVTKNKNVNKMDQSQSSKSVKSSTAFFTQLQEEMKDHVKSKVKRPHVKDTSVTSAKKMKL